MKYPELFKPFTIGRCQIKNRIVMSPMHLGGRMDSDGNFNESVIDYYVARAKGGVGLIYTCGFVPDSGIEKGLSTNSPFSDMFKFNTTSSRLCEKVHAYGAKIFFEVGGGTGRVTFPAAMSPEMNGHPIAPSEIPNRWDPAMMCRPTTTAEIRKMIDDTVQGAVASMQAGADGILLGGIYGGYLTDQYATRIFNNRDDEYGYGKKGQLKFVTDTIKGIKEACGPNTPVDVRIGVKHYMKGIRQGALPGEEFEEVGRDVAESIEYAKELEAAGATALLIGDGCYDSFYWLYPPTYQKLGLWLDNAQKVKEAVSIPVICPGRLNNPDIANQAIADGKIDAAAFGRPLLADPDFANKARRGASEDIRPCIGCENGCIGRVFVGGLVTCAVNPQCFYENTEPILPALIKKHVVVVGGGVGGMEAARVAALRGHEVDLYEKSDKLGGNFILAGVPDFKTDDEALIEWYITAIKKAGVKIHMNTEVTADLVEAIDADEVIVATGAVSRTIPIEGISKEDAVTASDVLSGAKPVGDSCVVIGGGLVGCEMAIWLARQGKKVTIVEMMPELMLSKVPVPLPNKLMIDDMLVQEGIDTITSAATKAYRDGSLIYADKNGNEHAIPADTVIQSIGYVPVNKLYNELCQRGNANVWNVGDSKMPTNIMNAIKDGFFIGKDI